MTLATFNCVTCGAGVRRFDTPPGPVQCRQCLVPDDEALHRSVSAAASERLARRLARFDQAGGFAGAVLPEHPTTRWERLALTAVADHKKRLSARSPGRGGLVFIGPTGIGKTRAAIAIVKAVGDLDAAGVAAVTESELLNPGVAPWDLPAHITRMVAGRHCLFVDEIGSVSRQPDQVMAGWREVAEHLHASPLPVLFIATTNRQSWASSGGLSEWMGAQTVSRLNQFCQMATTGWVDHRTGAEHSQWQAALTTPASAAP